MGIERRFLEYATRNLVSVLTDVSRLRVGRIVINIYQDIRECSVYFPGKFLGPLLLLISITIDLYTVETRNPKIML
jgi:hypothetical protein